MRALAQSGAKVSTLDLSEEAVKKPAEELKANDYCRIAKTPNVHFGNVAIVWQTIREEMTRFGWQRT